MSSVTPEPVDSVEATLFGLPLTVLLEIVIIALSPSLLSG